MGLTVSRQTAKNLPVKKAVVISRQTALRSFKSRTAGSQRIFLTGITSFHVPKYTHFRVFSTLLLLD